MTHSTRRLAAIGAAALSAVLVLSACSSGGSGDGGEGAGDLTPVKLQLQWLPQGQFAGYYTALEQGYFEEEGLEVEIIPSGGDIVPQDALANGEVDYAIAWVPKVLGSIEQGAKITNVAQIFERSATTQISFKDKNITSPAQLAGKKVGSWGFGNEWELFAGMQKAGVALDDITLVQQAFDMNGFLSGDIDAAQAMTYNEYAQLLETPNPDTGELYQPEDFNVISYEDTEGAMLQDAIWADTERLESDAEYEETTVAFLKAVIKGWAFVRDNPEEAANIVAESGSELGESHQLWMANEVNKLIWPSTNGVGSTDQAAWDQTVKIAIDGKVLKAQPEAEARRDDINQKALEALKADGIDVNGANYQPIEVEITEGGN